MANAQNHILLMHTFISRSQKAK